MSNSDLGPLAKLLGTWEGNEGEDVSPAVPDKMKTDIERGFFERWVFNPIVPAVENHEQELRQIGCNTDASRGNPSTAGKKAGESFHSQRGYWTWDRDTGIILSSFAVPRGIVVNAGAKIEADAKKYTLVAEAGDEIFGVCQNPFLIENFKVVKYILEIEFIDDDTIKYFQNTQLKIKGREEIFDHTDTNLMRRIK